MSYTKGYRYDVIPGSNDKYCMNFKEIQNPAYAASIAVSAKSQDSNEILVDFQKLTGALTVTADVVQPFVGDKMICLFAADTSDRVVTFSTGFAANGTLTVLDDGIAVVEFIFTSAGVWLERGRFISAELA